MEEHLSKERIAQAITIGGVLSYYFFMSVSAYCFTDSVNSGIVITEYIFYLSSSCIADEARLFSNFDSTFQSDAEFCCAFAKGWHRNSPMINNIKLLIPQLWILILLIKEYVNNTQK